MVRVYPSKVDAWLGALVVLACVAVVAAAFDLWSSGATSARLGAVFALGMGGFTTWVTFGIRYSVGGGHLAIRAGPFRWSVGIADIVAVRSTRAPWSAPAASLDRLRIDLRSGVSPSFLLVSPADREGFLDALVAEDSGLARHGDGLARRGTEGAG